MMGCIEVRLAFCSGKVMMEEVWEGKRGERSWPRRDDRNWKSARLRRTEDDSSHSTHSGQLGANETRQ